MKHKLTKKQLDEKAKILKQEVDLISQKIEFYSELLKEKEDFSEIKNIIEQQTKLLDRLMKIDTIMKRMLLIKQKMVQEEIIKGVYKELFGEES